MTLTFLRNGLFIAEKEPAPVFPYMRGRVSTDTKTFEGTNIPNLSRTNRSALCGLIAICMLISSCADPADIPDQVLVKGEDFEITIQEYDQLLRQAPPVTKDAIGPMRHALMEGLITEKLLAEEAVKAGLDKQPETAQVITAARRSALAQAYVRKLVGDTYRPSENEMLRYYAMHPDRFGKRRRFEIVEYVIRSDLPQVGQYVKDLDGGGLPALAKNLETALPEIEPSTVTRFSDQIPDTDDHLLARMRAGDTVVYQTPGQIHLGSIQSASVEPITFAAAKPRIEAALIADRRAGIVKYAVAGYRKDREVKIVKAELTGSNIAQKESLQ